jgi:hypothetical protein
MRVRRSTGARRHLDVQKLDWRIREVAQEANLVGDYPTESALEGVFTSMVIGYLLWLRWVRPPQFHPS